MFFIKEGLRLRMSCQSRGTVLSNQGLRSIYRAFNDRHALSLPIIAAPMDTVSESNMATAMDQCGGMAIFIGTPIGEQCKHVRRLLTLWSEPQSVCLETIWKEPLTVSAGCRFLCIDIAHHTFS